MQQTNQKYMLKIIGKKKPMRDARNFTKTFDVDCNGRVSYDELVKLTRCLISFPSLESVFNFMLVFYFLLS